MVAMHHSGTGKHHSSKRCRRGCQFLFGHFLYLRLQHHDINKDFGLLALAAQVSFLLTVNVRAGCGARLKLAKQNPRKHISR
jgi:hypothetical protein